MTDLRVKDVAVDDVIAWESQARAVFRSSAIAEGTGDAAAIERIVGKISAQAPVATGLAGIKLLRVLAVVASLGGGTVGAIALERAHDGAVETAEPIELAPLAAPVAARSSVAPMIAPAQPELRAVDELADAGILILEEPEPARRASLPRGRIAAEKPVPLTSAAAPAVSTPEPVESAESIEPTVSAPEEEVVESADELFARANAARDAGEHDDAAALYRRVVEEHPRSHEAAVARVSLGSAYLGPLSRPADALAWFDRYLRAAPDGALAERALLGRAEANARLGKTKSEQRAWLDLIEQFPDSLHADRAKARIEALRR